MTKSTNLKVAGAVAFYFAVSLSITFLNKHILRGFSYPLSVTLFQQAVALAVLLMLTTFGVLGFSKISPVKPDALRLPYLRATLPLGILHLLMVCSTNISMADVNLVFLQFLRALVVPFSVLFSGFVLGTWPSQKALMAAGSVVCGFFIGALTEMEFSTRGFVSGVLSSMFCAAYSVQAKRTLPKIGGSSWVMLLYNCIWDIFLLAPWCILSGELASALEASVALRSTPMFTPLMFVSGLLGLGINLAYFLQIQFCTPLTSHISGSAKSAVQSILSIMLDGVQSSPLNRAGLGVVVLGSWLYSWIRFKESGASNTASKSKPTKKQTKSKTEK